MTLSTQKNIFSNRDKKPNGIKIFLIITLSIIVQSSWFRYLSTQLEELFQMSYYLYIRIFHPKNHLGPPYGFSIFRGLYLDPQAFPHIGSGTIRLTSSRRIEWYVFRFEILWVIDYTTAPLFSIFSDIIFFCNENNKYSFQIIFFQKNELLNL